MSSFGIFNPPIAKNEPVMSYAPGSPERKKLKETLEELRSKVIDIPMIIGGKEIRTGNTKRIAPPHDHQHTIAHYHRGDASHVQMAIEASLKAKKQWENLPWEQRAAVFLRMADLLAGPYRFLINASTMLAQSKNSFQAEIDAACELIDFLKFNVQFADGIYREQPESLPLTWNRLEYRALEGFIFALTPFNFTSICANLSCAPAMMGNVIVWKPSETQIYSAYFLMQLFKEAGLPDGVVNMVLVGGRDAGEVIFKHSEFAGLHFTGSTETFQTLWMNIASNLKHYRSYPRIVGETGGKDFVIAHHSANPDVVATALSRGAFEYQGQKCSAASRAYVPESLWPAVKEKLQQHLAGMKMGPAEDFTNFINAVIDETSFNNIVAYIDKAKADGVEIVAGGNYDKSKGYFVEPTVLRVDDPKYRTMCEEIFGPVLTIYVYKDEDYAKTLDLVDSTSPYALTGAVISTDRYAIELATNTLRNAAGNFYINDKPTGAVVGQQPFGGGRSSGTNDKAGAAMNLMRWVSARTIKENLNPPTTWEYPFHQAD